MFFIVSDEEYLINRKIDEIIKEFNDYKVYKFGSETKINEIINQISSFSLFDDKRILIFDHLMYLDKASKSEIESIINAFLYKVETTKLIFTYTSIEEKISKNELTNFLITKSKYIKIKKLTDQEIVTLVKEKIKLSGATISDIDLFYFLSKIPNKISVILNEIDKLTSLDKNINKTNIDDLIQKYNMGTAFDFINAFHNGNSELLFKSFNEKLNQGETIQNFINQIVNVLELCSRIYSLKKLKYSEKEISEKLNKHAFVIKKNNEFLNLIGYEKICDYTNIIADIDVKIKKGIIQDKIAFERFLLEIIRFN